MNIRVNIKLRSVLVAVLVFVVFGMYAFQLVKLQVVDGNKIIEQASKSEKKKEEVEFLRGNIYSSDGKTMAVSVPFFDIRFDVFISAENKTFQEDINALSIKLSKHFKDKSPQQYYDYIMEEGYKRGNRYLLIAKNVRYIDLKKISQFPVFKNGRYKGGFIIESRYKRVFPFADLANRTVGYSKNGSVLVGVEGAFNRYLEGQVRTVSAEESYEAEALYADIDQILPKRGNDVVTTIDINIQDIAYNALLNQLEKTEAEYGTMVVMEVQTGEIKAIVNLTGDDKGQYKEEINHAISESVEPGSLFKLASYLVCLEEGVFDIDKKVNVEKSGIYRYKGSEIRDHHKEGLGQITMREAFEKSSNIAIAKKVIEHYGENDDDFIQGLKDIHLDKKLGLQIEGERAPFLRERDDEKWSKTTNPWTSFGYESKFTPLQILTLYNAVANNGKMIAPLLVKQVKDLDKEVEAFQARVIDNSIASKKTIQTLQSLLSGVVERGTAKNIHSSIIPISGKTGTTQMYDTNLGKYSRKNHRASFCGYFPSDNPTYSCIVVIGNPRKNGYTGAQVAAPVLKKLVSEVYAIDPNIGAEPSSKNEESVFVVHNKDVEEQKETVRVDSESVREKIKRNMAVMTSVKKESIYEIPNVVGLDLSAAVYLLSQAGIKPIVVGDKVGTVVKQGLKPGDRVSQHTTMRILLQL